MIPGELRIFLPLPDSHPAVGSSCQRCWRAFRAGDRTCLLTIADVHGNGSAEGLNRSQEAVLLHARCALDVLEANDAQR
jgi:hypothetical protein